jgi:beta-galactosidase
MPVEVRDRDGVLTIDAGLLEVVFEKTNGVLASIRFGGVEVVERGPQLELWRAATDNDGIKLWSNQDNKPLGRWLALGLDKLQRRRRAFRWSAAKDGASVTVVVRHEASGRDRWNDATHEHRYTITADGALRCDNLVRFGAKDMTDLPRVGVSLQLPAGFETLRFFGRGPHENYADRKAAAHVGLHATTVSETYVPYVMPQEHGHFTDVRWLELARGGSGPVVRVARDAADELLEFNASHFSAADLFAAKHTPDLAPRAETILTLDAAHRGLGTASCGPDTLERHRLLAKTYRWGFTLTARDD